MSQEHNRYREEEKELKEENLKNQNVNEEPQIIDDQSNENSDVEHHSEEENVDKQKNKKNKKQKKVEDFEEYQQLAKEVAKLKDDLLRNRADLENFKKRNNEERIRERKYALQDFLMDLIDVIDIYDKAVNIKTEDEKINKFLSGFIMINNMLKQKLANYEVKQIDALNKEFDPRFHNAVETVEKEGVEANIVVEVIMTGYTYKDRVLRPSMVKVSK